MSSDRTDRDIGPGSARELAQLVGERRISDLRSIEPELAAAVCELASSGGNDWLRGADDSLVVLLRSLARLSIISPDAAGARTARLIAAITTSDGERASLDQPAPSSPFAACSFTSPMPQVS